MAGLIRRLARDAVSPTRPTIHAMARLPYMPPPALLPIEEAGAPAAAVMPGAMSPTPAAADHATSAVPPPGASSGPQSAVADDASRSAIDSDLSDEPGIGPSLDARPPSSSRPSSVHPPSRPADPLPAALMPASPARRPTPPGASAGTPEAAEKTTSTSARGTLSFAFEPAPTSAAPQAHAPDPPATRSANARTLPDALLPPFRQGAHSTLSSPAAASTQHTPAATESTTEVHVHIGRIEVTAMQPPATPRPAARTGRPPMSLDEYLARRERRGS